MKNRIWKSKNGGFVQVNCDCRKCRIEMLKRGYQSVPTANEYFKNAQVEH
jgi:hypothetical protein